VPFRFPEKSLRWNVNRMNAWQKSAGNKVQEPDWKDDIRPCLSIDLPTCFVYGRALFSEKLRYDTEILKKIKLRRLFFMLT
jgi:hypothetical protein